MPRRQRTVGPSDRRLRSAGPAEERTLPQPWARTARASSPTPPTRQDSTPPPELEPQAGPSYVAPPPDDRAPTPPPPQLEPEAGPSLIGRLTSIGRSLLFGQDDPNGGGPSADINLTSLRNDEGPGDPAGDGQPSEPEETDWDSLLF